MATSVGSTASTMRSSTPPCFCVRVIVDTYDEGDMDDGILVEVAELIAEEIRRAAEVRQGQSA